MINCLPLQRIHEARRVIFEQAEPDGRKTAIAVVDEAAALVLAERVEGCDARAGPRDAQSAYVCDHEAEHAVLP